jgi:hypothetical protein
LSITADGATTGEKTDAVVFKFEIFAALEDTGDVQLANLSLIVVVDLRALNIGN